jgi:hypothetical protein
MTGATSPAPSPGAPTWPDETYRCVGYPDPEPWQVQHGQVPCSSWVDGGEPDSRLYCALTYGHPEDVKHWAQPYDDADVWWTTEQEAGRDYA